MSMWAIEYKAKNGRWVFVKEDDLLVDMFITKIQTQCHINYTEVSQYIDALPDSARPVKIKIVRGK